MPSPREPAGMTPMPDAGGTLLKEKLSPLPGDALSLSRMGPVPGTGEPDAEGFALFPNCEWIKDGGKCEDNLRRIALLQLTAGQMIKRTQLPTSDTEIQILNSAER